MFERKRIRSNYKRLLLLLQVVALLLYTASPMLRRDIPVAYTDPYPPYWDNGTGESIHYLPAPWPADGDWKIYTRGGQSINDPRTQDPSNGGTRPQNYVNVSSGYPDQSQPSVYYAYNPISQTIFFRFKIEQIANTYATGPSAATYANGDPWNAGTWSVLIDIDGDGYREFVLMLDGQTGTPSGPIDRVASLYSDTPNHYIDYWNNSDIKLLEHNPTGFVDRDTGKILNFHNNRTPDTSWPNGAAETTWDYGTTRAINISTSNAVEYIIDYQIPLGMLDATSVGGPQITSTTPIAFLFATANSNQNPLQKDAVFLGDYITDPTKPAPFGDPTTIGGDPDPSPVVTTVSAMGCNPASLSAEVLDMLDMVGGVAQTTVASVDFFYYYDANANGLADDGSNEWEFAAPGISNTSQLGIWTASWLTATELVKGQYLIGARAVDTASPANTTRSWADNPSPDPGQVWATFQDNCGVNPPNISKSVSPATVAVGATVTFTIQIDNPTSDDITVSTITDTLPSGFSFGATTGGTFSPTTSPTLGATGDITWTFSPAVTITASSSKTLIFTTTAPSVTGSYLNRALAQTSYGTLDTDLTTEVNVGNPYLSIAKSTTVASVAPGGNVTFTISYGNDSTIRATGVVISDVLPSGTSFVDADSGGTYDTGTGTVIWSVGELAPGDGGYSVQLVLQVANPYGGSTPLANTATIMSNETSPASATAYTNVSQPELSLSKSADKSVAMPGSSVVFTLTYANVSSNQVTGAILTDVLPSGLTFASASNGGLSNGQTVTWSLGTLSAGASGSKNVTATVSSPFTYTNPAPNIAYLDSNETNVISDTYYLGVASLSSGCDFYYFRAITQSVGFDGQKQIANTTFPTSSNPTILNRTVSGAVEIVRYYQDPPLGQTTYFTGPLTTTLWVDKIGGPKLDMTVRVMDYDPATGATTLLGASTVAQEVGNPKLMGYDFSISPTGTVASGHRLLWIFEASSTGSASFDYHYDGISTDSKSRFCTSQPPELVLDKAASVAQITPPGTMSYTLSFGNRGGVTTTNTILTDALPSGVTYVDSSARLDGTAITPTYNQTSNVLTFTVSSSDQTATSGKVTPGRQGTLTYTVSVAALSPSVQTLTNTAYLTSSETSRVSSTVTTAVVQPLLSIGKAASDSLLYPGDSVTFTLTVLNGGDGAASNVVITDVLSAESYFTYTTGSASDGGTYVEATKTITWNVASLAAGASASRTFRMLVATSGVPSGTTQKTNSATAKNNGAGSTISSNVVTVTISSNPNLTISKQATPSTTLSASDLLTYTITIGNEGSSDAVGTTLRDAIPDYLSFVPGSITLQGVAKTDASDGDSATYDAANNVIEWNIGTLASQTSGITATYTARVDFVLPNGTTNITNTATVAASNAASKSASVVSQAQAEPVLEISKVAPATLPYPLTNLALAASGTTTVTVNSTALLGVGNLVYINGTTATINAIDPDNSQIVLSNAVTAPQGAAIYGTIEFVVSYENSGDAQATSVVITDLLQSGLTYVSSSPSATQNGQTLSWSIGTLDADSSGQVRVIVRPTATGTYTNTAQIKSSQTTITNSNTTTTEVGAPILDKRTTTPTVSQTLTGASATYVFTVTNPLGVTVNGVIVTDTMASGFTYASTLAIAGYDTGSSPSDPAVGANPASWGTFSIAAGGSLVISYTAYISPSVGAATYQNDVDATSTNYSVIDFDPLVTIAVFN